ncbi:MAG: alpha/beta fold hydrolase [Chloroflexota bacterium]
MTFSINRYLNVQAAYAPSFSANQDWLYFLSNATGQAQVWRFAWDDGAEGPSWPNQMTFDADRVMGLITSPANGRFLCIHDHGGNENAQFTLFEPSTGQETALTAGFEHAMHIPGEWSKDGQRLLFSANRRHRGLFDLYSMDLESREVELIWQNEAAGYLRTMLWHPNGRFVTVLQMISSTEGKLWEVDSETGQARLLSPADQTASYGAIAYSKDGRFLYAVTDLGSDFRHIIQLDRATGHHETLVQPNWDVGAMALSPNGRYLAYTINQDGADRLELIDFATGMSRPAPFEQNVPGVIGAQDGKLTFSPDSRHLAFSFTGATSGSNIYVWAVELAEDRITAVTHVAHGGLPLDSFVVPDLIHYPTFDGLSIPAWYFKPANTENNLPVVVLVHGGPEGQSRPSFNFLAQYLVQHGYAVFVPNVRGSTGYGKAYAQLDNVEKRMDSVADLAYGAYWLHEQEEVDNGRIAVYGGSYGGFMVLSALTTYPDLWAAGVNIVGISNFVTFLENTSDYRRAHREAEYGTLAHDRDFLESVSPINHIDKLVAPLMVIHGANDPRVPLSEAEQLVAALQQRNVSVDFLVFEDEGHGLAKLKNKQVAYPAIVRFLQQQLG